MNAVYMAIERTIGSSARAKALACLVSALAVAGLLLGTAAASAGTTAHGRQHSIAGGGIDDWNNTVSVQPAIS
ncbi:hypothetical protein [Streptomyces sp. L2]|uniref:hypothetical protein n=1 Tax=Streptomyces sp. L2 TaxID=2162665 RepID=UPI0010103D8A|nr:hypothetical protein [Streptomyces sp. L2]